MEIAERSFQSAEYRYGFNGKENDREWGTGGLTQDYGFRLYNPSIGKFLSVDPLFQSYPWYTPYQFAGNNPMWAVDLDGLEELRQIKWNSMNINVSVHKVTRGEYPIGIASQYNVELETLRRWNSSLNGRMISILGLNRSQYSTLDKRLDLNDEQFWIDGFGYDWAINPNDELIVGIETQTILTFEEINPQPGSGVPHDFLRRGVQDLFDVYNPDPDEPREWFVGGTGAYGLRQGVGKRTHPLENHFLPDDIRGGGIRPLC